MGNAIDRADRMRFRHRICSLDCTTHWYYCQLTADLNFKSFKTFLISAKGTYYFTSNLPASSPLEIYKNFLPLELAAKMLSSLGAKLGMLEGAPNSSVDEY